ncbi:MAG: DUF3440 domain-containing protein, partial [Bacilli bacterium]
MKKYIKTNVYDAALERIEYLFNEFDNVLVAFSGGKDSGVVLNLCYDYAKRTNQLHKLAMYHLDYEAQYQMTTDYVDEVFDKLDIRKFRLCLPVKAQCSVNLEGGYWKPWELSKKDLWVREMPKNSVINEDNVEFEYKDLFDYDVQDNFCKWFNNKYGKTATVIGIRTDESLNRVRAIVKDSTAKYNNKIWINSNNHCKAYPIYDWSTDDIWICNYKNNYSYNKLYDLFYQAGLTIEQMRVASPFNDSATSSLKLYKVIDPINWGKMTSRVNGVNFAGLYGGTTAMGWKSITKPKHLTWKQ